MQERIRYYITKSGEELTVRSVKVEKGSPRRDDHDPSTPDEGAEAKPASGPGSLPAGSVRRRDNAAGRVRPTES